MKNRKGHPAFGEWVDFVEGRDEPGERRDSEAHLLEGCRACRDSVAWISRITGTMAEDDFVDPPGWVVARARNLFRPAPPEERGAANARIPASLLPGFGAPALAVRELAFRPPSRLERWRAEGREFLIEVIEEPGGTWTLRGSLATLPEVGRPPFVFASVERGEETEAAAPAGPLGDFEFARLAPGAVRVVVEVDGDEYAFEPVLLG